MKNIKILKGCFGQLGESTEREVSSQDWYFVMLFSFEEARGAFIILHICYSVFLPVDQI